MTPSQLVSPGSEPSTSETGVTVRVSSGVQVGTGVHVGTAVQVGTGVHVGTGVGVLIGVGVLNGVGVTVTVDVTFGVGVAVGETNVIDPCVVVNGRAVLAVSVSVTTESTTAETPWLTVLNWTVVSTPVPLGPAATPVVLQPNVTVVAVVVGAGQVTVRVVEPRNEPFDALINERTAASQVSVKL